MDLRGIRGKTEEYKGGGGGGRESQSRILCTLDVSPGGVRLRSWSLIREMGWAMLWVCKAEHNCFFIELLSFDDGNQKHVV